MKFGMSSMPEYSLTRQRQDYKGKQDVKMHFQHYMRKYAIGNQKIHIINKYRRLGHTVMNHEYWDQYHAERSGLRASSWMYSYGSLPTTKQLADNNMCNLLITCCQIYHEVVMMLYSTNSFVFWDLRTVSAMERRISLGGWEAVRCVETCATLCRREDIKDVMETRSLLQLEAWPAV
ncbi:hypothetical protein GQ44DRAFT_763601 [Phaeosphaeriaceae sp. PMI808]|nr:hypothetical protein GQ44DRAFT_763601 [Phaeosphaeriaceae sp. PMI808]